MDKFKILLLTQDFSVYVSRNVHYFAQELSKVSDLIVWTEPGDINSILKSISLKPDFILVNSTMPDNCPTITGLSSINIPLGMIMTDLHFTVGEQKRFIIENNVKFLFSNCRDAFIDFYPEFLDRAYWLPHFVNTDIFKDYNLPKDIDYLMMGNITSKQYGFRKHMVEVMQKEPGFVFHPHPGYRNVDDQNEYVGERYAKEINRSKIFLTEDSLYHYPVKKYYEVTACKTLLLAPASHELKDLGFIPGINFVAVTENDFLQKARYYLLHEKEREEIALRGYEMVHTRHNSKKRISEFINTLKKVL